METIQDIAYRYMLSLIGQSQNMAVILSIAKSENREISADELGAVVRESVKAGEFIKKDMHACLNADP